MSRNVIEALSRFYGPSAIYAHEIVRLREMGGSQMARVFYTVSRDQASQRFDQLPLDTIKKDASGLRRGMLTVTENHAVDHFNGVKVFPGHKIIRAAVDYAVKLSDSRDHLRVEDQRMRLLGFESVEFKKPVIPPCQINLSEQDIDPELATRTIVIDNCKDVIARIAGLRVGFLTRKGEVCPGPALMEDQLIEAMAQAAAVTALNFDELPEGIPLFLGTGRTRFYGKVLEGCTINMMTTTVQEKGGFRGKVQVLIGSKIIAETEDLKAMIVPARVAERMLGIKLDKS